MLYSFVFVSALAASSLAAPLSKRTFQITQIPNPDFRGLDGPKAVARAYARYGIPITDALSRAASAAGTVQPRGNTGSVTAIPQSYDFEYLCPVTIGGQTMSLNFDTGSSDLWVFSQLMPADQLSGHTYYDSTKSSTFKTMANQKWAINYLDGSQASGVVGTDVVSIGGASTTASVELATTASQSFLNDKGTSGLLGLGWPSINQVSPNKQLPFFWALKDSLAAPVFTVALKKNAPGRYDFGYIDPAKYTGKISYVNVNNTRGWWQFGTNGFKIGSSSYRLSMQNIADTGTSIMLLDKAVVSAYYGKVVGATWNSVQGGYTFPCGTPLPDFSLDLGAGYYGVISGSLLNYGPLFTGSPICFGSIQGNGNLGFQVLGDVFFKSQFVVFNPQTQQLGFAPQA